MALTHRKSFAMVNVSISFIGGHMGARTIRPIPEFRAAVLEVPEGFVSAISITENGESRFETLPDVYFYPLTAQLFAKAAVELRKHEAIRTFFANLAQRVDGGEDARESSQEDART